MSPPKQNQTHQSQNKLLHSKKIADKFLENQTAGVIIYQPQKCSIDGETPQIYHTYICMFDPPTYVF